MANGAALIRETLWRDRDFRALPRTAQCLYLQLLSQKDLDCAGILTINRDLLVKGCNEMTLADLDHDLKTLAESRFIVIDTDTDEILIRSYIRHVSIKSPNAWKSAKRIIGRVGSPRILPVVAVELRWLGRGDANDLANEITAAHTPSEPHPNPIRTPSEGDIPSEWDSKPPSPVPVRVLNSPLVDGWVGRAPTGAPTCPKHPNGPNHHEPCRDCQRIREHTQATERAQAEAAAAAAEARRTAIGDCDYCDHNGMRETPDGLARCTHNPDTFAFEPF